tara:strand:- start:244 stop:852 length:609 start_codon:yes stop_codon:yes gene_type:complete
MRKNRIDLKIKKTPSFMGCWLSNNKELFKNIINFYDDNLQLHRTGMTGEGLNPDRKSSTDITIKPIDLKKPEYSDFNDYFELLYGCFIDYVEQWPFLKKLQGLDIGPFNIQKYEKGDHFSYVHSERMSLKYSDRVFAWMTYLNDVKSGGETYFDHFDLNIKPETGKTLIWPSEWTHAHSGGIVNEEKYIITGWINFPSYEDD